MNKQELSEKNKQSIVELMKQTERDNKVVGRHIKKHLDFNAKMKKLFRHDLDKEFAKYDSLLNNIGVRMIKIEERMDKIEGKEKK